MAYRSGIGAQLGFKAETTFGTYVAPDRFLEFNSEGLVENREKIVSAGIRRGSYVQRAGRWAENKKGGGGPATFEVATKAFGLLFKHAMGAVAITTPGGATNARQHEHTLGDLDDLSLTIQKGVPGAAGTTHPFSFLGCVITGWELSVEVDGLVMFTPTFDARAMVDTESLASASFASGDELFGYQQVAIEVAGVSASPTSATISVSHGLAVDRYKIRASGLKDRPVRNAFAEIGGTLTFEFDSMTQANYFLDRAPGSEIAVQMTATGDEIDSGVNNFALDVLAAKCVFDGSVPAVAGPDIVTVEAPFIVVDDLSAEPLVVTYTTTDTAS